MLKWIVALALVCASPFLLAQASEKQTAASLEEAIFKLTQGKSSRDVAAALPKLYVDSGWQDAANRKADLSTGELQQLFSVQFIFVFYGKQHAHLQLLESTFAALEARNQVERKHVRDLYEQQIRMRTFAQATALAKKYPAFDLGNLPQVVAGDLPDNNTRAIWVIDKTGNRLTREPVRFSPDWQLVAISHPLCHFSKSALVDIKNDQALAKSLEGRLTLIGPQDGNLHFEVLQKWNIENPSMPIHFVDQESAFSEFERWVTPTFYFMRAGKVIHQFSGWPKGGNRAQLNEGLQKVGAISGEARRGNNNQGNNKPDNQRYY
jgi:hypothetical protein